jgi:hypothetical protein
MVIGYEKKSNIYFRGVESSWLVKTNPKRYEHGFRAFKSICRLKRISAIKS